MDINIELARLDGYLSGIAVFAGHAGDCSANAYMVPMSGGSESIGRDINLFYLGQTHFQFDTVEKLERGMHELEDQLGPYLTQNVLGVRADLLDPHEMRVRQTNTAFWVMDMATAIIEGGHLGSVTKSEVFKLRSFDISYGQSVFFCILLRRHMLIMQFSDRSKSMGSPISRPASSE